MNPAGLEEAVALAERVKAGVGQAVDVHVAICPPAVYLHRIDDVVANSPIGLGAQDMHWKPKGAFTGELSGPMLNEAGCTHVILGHSERRHGLGETDAEVNQKLKAALSVPLYPIVCIGETLEEREAGRTEAVVRGQLLGSLLGDFSESTRSPLPGSPVTKEEPFAISAEDMGKVVLAYEPVWAIGTGKTATPEQAQEVHAFIRRFLAERFGEATAGRVIVQYGGSVKPDNAEALLACPDIDGALVGGASLNPDDFLPIIKAGRAVTEAGKR
jgi:triosephosphate isomerase